MLQETKFEIRGLTPLLMHNGQLADPLNEHAKRLSKLTSSKAKTDAYHESVADCEWRGSLYVDESGAPCIPAEVLESCLVEGAKKMKLGKVAKGALVVVADAPLVYKGSRDPEVLIKDKSFRKRAGVRVGQSRIIRTRPMFSGWSCTFVVRWDPDMIKDEDQICEIVESAGQCGLGDWRPKFGRFEVEA